MSDLEGAAMKLEPRKPTDTDRLDFLVSREARIGWDREGEKCRLFRYDSSACNYVPICGWRKWFKSGRAAIDAALKKEKT